MARLQTLKPRVQVQGTHICGIYKIINAANGKCYVGSSVNVDGRLYQHLALLRKGRHHNAHLQSAFTAHGEDAFRLVILERCGKGDLLDREQRHLDALKPEYNICAVAGNTLGYKHGIEAKAKMTEANLGNKRMLGKHHTEETKRLIGAKAALRTHTAEMRAKISASLMGNRHTAGTSLSPEHRAKVSAGLFDAWTTCRNREDAAMRLRAMWSDPTWKARQVAKIRAGKAAKRLSNGMA